jgi:hypothetical protein
VRLAQWTRSALWGGLITYGAVPPTIVIDFERSTNPAAVPGATATTLYAEQGVLFPSNPTIQEDPFGGQMLQQGRALLTRPDPLRGGRIECGPLIMEFRPETGVREVQMRVLTRNLRAYDVRAYFGSAEVDAFEFYPSAGRRPPFTLDAIVTLRSEPGEGPITRVVANPPHRCFDLMAIDDLRLQTDAAAFNLVRALAFEVSQGVTSRLTRLSDPEAPVAPDMRLMALPDRSLALVRGRTTAVRFYLGSSLEDTDGYEAVLEATLYDAAGRAETARLAENTRPAEGAAPSEPSAPFTPTAPGEPGITRALVQRRARTDQSHDFVIPGAVLQNTERAVLRLLSPEGRILATVEARFHGPYVMGVNYLRLFGTGPARPIGPAVDGEPLRSQMQAFLTGIFPVAEPLRLRDQGVLEVDVPVPGCAELLGAAAAAAGDLGAGIAEVNYWTNLFVAQAPPGCGGYAWYNTPGALTSPNLSTAAQEIGHNIGMNHVSNLHGEAGGGREDWEPWPYLHGGIGAVDEARGFHEGVFGLVMTPRADGGCSPWFPAGRRSPARCSRSARRRTQRSRTTTCRTGRERP